MNDDHNMNQTTAGWRKRQIDLDKKAEKARELGLDYEPHKGTTMKTLIEKYDVWRKEYHPMALMNEAMAEAAWIAAYGEAVQAEREACAKVCETHGVHPALNVWNGGPDWYKHGKDCAAAIRARSNT
jgi:hypothetical protein